MLSLEDRKKIEDFEKNFNEKLDESLNVDLEKTIELFGFDKDLKGKCVYYHDINCPVQIWIRHHRLAETVGPKKFTDSWLDKAMQRARDLAEIQGNTIAMFCMQCPILMEKTKDLRDGGVLPK